MRKEILINTVEAMIPQAKRQYIIGVIDDELCQGIMDRTIPSTIANSVATSGVGTTDDPSHCTGAPYNKRFILPILFTYYLYTVLISMKHVAWHSVTLILETCLPCYSSAHKYA